MIKRPISITIIGWWLIVAGIFGALDSATLEMNPVAVQMAANSVIPIEVRIIFGMINGMVVAACGIGFLKGLWWSRMVYLIWSLAGFALGFFISPLWFTLAVLVFYGITLSILCRRSANLWFEASAY